MRRVVKLILALIIAGFLSSLPMARAMVADTSISDENLVASARAIVAGKVLRIESRWDEKRKDIYTDITISVSQVLKGNIATRTIVIEQLGGHWRDRQSWLTGSPQFANGEEVLLFLNTNKEGVLHTAHLGMGKFSIAKSPQGMRMLKRAGSHERVDADQYIAHVKQLMIDQAVQIAQFDQMYGTNLVVVPPDYHPGNGEIMPAFTLLTARFYQPDTDMPVTFLVNPDNAPVSDGGMTEVNNAIAAWNAAGSRLHLVNGGMTDLCGLAMDNASVISFDDCLSQLDNPVNGQGMLGAVKMVVGDGNRVINGNTFAPIIESDIVFNNGFKKVLGISSNLEELITHFLGNAFGLDNSSTNPNEPNASLREAIMYFEPHFDGRGARLNLDDQTGVNKLYPFFTPVQIATTGLATPVLNVAFTQQINAANGFLPYTFALTDGMLPAGLSFSASGVISGTPTKVETQSFTITVTDFDNFQASQKFTLTINPGLVNITSVSPTRICYDEGAMITIKGTGLQGVANVKISQGKLMDFKIVDDNTIEADVVGPGQSGLVADVQVSNSVTSSTLPSVIVFDGPMLKSARLGSAAVTNSNGKRVRARGIIVKGLDVTISEMIKINGTLSMLPVQQTNSGDFIFFGTKDMPLKNVIPAKGPFNITLVDPGLSCESNSVKVARKSSSATP
jgi:hypothetical protein